LDEYEQKSKENNPHSDVVHFNMKYLKVKSNPVILPFENRAKKMKFDHNETALTFLNYYPSSSTVESID